jgi:hypothetical protein
MNNLTEEDKIEAREAILAANAGYSSIRKGSGYLVQTKHGKGRTFHVESLVNGKIPVFLSDGRKLLCNPDNVEFIGFVD